MKTHLFASLLLVSAAAPVALVSGSILQVADLKSILHGAPTAQPKAPPPKVTATVAFAPGVAADPQVEDFFRAFAAAVKARDGAPMRPRLSDRYSVPDLPEDMKPADFFVMGVERIPGPEAITIQSVEAKNDV